MGTEKCFFLYKVNNDIYVFDNKLNMRQI